MSRRAGELGISQELTQLLQPFIEQQSGFRDYSGNALTSPYRTGNPLGDLYADLGLDVNQALTGFGSQDLISADQLKDLLGGALTQIQNRYDYGNVLGPTRAADGAVKNTRLEALRKLLG